MMEYDVFKKVVEERILSFMPAGYGDFRVSVREVQKVNQTVDCLNLFPGARNTGKMTICPNVYLQELYQAFQKRQDMDLLLQETAVFLHAAMKKAEICLPLQAIREGDIRDQVVFSLINQRKNETLLKEVPHQRMLDLAAVYKVIQKTEHDEMYTMLVTKAFMHTLELDEDELHAQALINTKRLFPPRILSLKEAVGEHFGKEASKLSPEKTDCIYALTSESGANGAALLLFDDVLNQLKEKLNGGFYILPASIHQIFAVSDCFSTRERAAAALGQINSEFQHEGSFLSDRIYHYCPAERRLTIPGEKRILH